MEGTEDALARMLSNGIQGVEIADLARVRVPATVVFGQHDSSVPVSSGRRVAAVLHAPMTIIPGSGHLSLITHPRAVAAVIARSGFQVASAAMQGLVPQIEIDEAEDAARRARFPAGSAIEFADLELDSRVGALDRLREAEPISWVPALGGWLVTSHALARELLSRRDEFTVWAEPNLVRASLGVMMLSTDGDEHARQRRPFEEPFGVRPVRERFAEPVQRRVDAMVGELAPRGGCELVEEFAAPFAIGVAGDVLGLSLDDVARVQEFYEAFAGAMVYDGDPEPQRRADAARAELDAILLAEVERSRAQPDNSITSAVANDPARGLSDEEIVAQLRVILFGAIETVESTLANAVLLLLSEPRRARRRARGAGPHGQRDRGGHAADPSGRLHRALDGGALRARRRRARGGRVPRRQHGRREPRPGGVPRSRALRRAARERAPPPHAEPRPPPLPRLQPRAHAVPGRRSRRSSSACPGSRSPHAPEPTGFAFRRPATLELRWAEVV